MKRVEFVDTSILVEFLNVPGRNKHREQVLADFKRKRASGVHFVLPTAAVIETGNHVHHIGDGSKRRSCARAFAELLRLTAAGKAPWVLFEARWDGALLTRLEQGAGTNMDIVEHAAQRGLSCGDLSVIAERNEYRQSVSKGAEVVIWSFDHAMSAWS